jgi:eukaryotic translation initiation factor 2C
VDTDVVDPYTFQFFLASHAAIQGVTKPTKYCILHDDSNFNADDLQAITYGKKLENINKINFTTLYF